MKSFSAGGGERPPPQIRHWKSTSVKNPPGKKEKYLMLIILLDLAGEADAAKTNYYCTFPAMIRDWRSKFQIGTKGETDPTFPFGFVQVD